MHQMNRISGAFLAALRRAEHRREPFDYWLLEDVLPETVCDAIADLPFSPPDNATFDGRRETNNARGVYFTLENQQRFVGVPRSSGRISPFPRPERHRAHHGHRLGDGAAAHRVLPGRRRLLAGAARRYPVKLFTMLVYLADAPELHDAGTDIYDDSPEHKLVASVPCEWNAGLIFIPGKNTWHGFSKRPIRGVRKSIINFVAPEWRAGDELA